LGQKDVRRREDPSWGLTTVPKKEELSCICLLLLFFTLSVWNIGMVAGISVAILCP
jgi:uncharacterized membrane protein YhdT